MRRVWAVLGLLLLLISVQEFTWHALWRGWFGLGGDNAAQGRLVGTRISDVAVFGHMITGGVITTLAVLQWAGPIRARWPVIHRLSGRILAPLAVLTGVAGLIYILLRGTIGGPIMNVGFALYGVLMIVAALQTFRLAQQRDVVRHRRWGLRLIVLALGSWIYRAHYGIWFAITCGIGPETCRLGSQKDFSGLFDQIQVFAFYLPYLLIVEICLRLQSARGALSAP